jgi:hypothetical protein
MTLTLAGIEARLERVCDQLEEELLGFRTLCERQANAEADFKLAYAKAMLDTSIEKETVVAKEARATMCAAVELRTYKVLDMQVLATRESLRSLHALIDVLRTQAANLRSLPGV